LRNWLARGRLGIDRMESVLAQMQDQRRAGVRQEDELKAMAQQIDVGKRVLRLAQLSGVEVRLGGPVGLNEFPMGSEHLVLHPFKEPEALRKASKLALSGSGTEDNPDLFYARLGDLSKVQMEALLAKAKALDGSTKATGAGGRAVPAAARMVIFAGNSAWGPLQLSGEIRGGLGHGSSWGWIPASPREVLRADARRTWKELNASKMQSSLKIANLHEQKVLGQVIEERASNAVSPASRPYSTSRVHEATFPEEGPDAASESFPSAACKQ